MYEVTVFYIGENFNYPTDSDKFKFGAWAEIGMWLDMHGYNDARYRVEVKFG